MEEEGGIDVHVAAIGGTPNTLVSLARDCDNAKPNKVKHSRAEGFAKVSCKKKVQTSIFRRVEILCKMFSSRISIKPYYDHCR